MNDYYRRRMEMFAHNRRIAAVRESWPDGVLETCVRLDAAHPGWAVTWMGAGRWGAMMPDETAYLVSGLGWRRPWVYAATAVELVERIGVVDGEIERAIRARDMEWARRPA